MMVSQTKTKLIPTAVAQFAKSVPLIKHVEAIMIVLVVFVDAIPVEVNL